MHGIQCRTRPARQVMFWAESSQFNSPLFNGVAGQVEVPAGQVNLCCTLFSETPSWKGVAGKCKELVLEEVRFATKITANYWLNYRYLSV